MKKIINDIQTYSIETYQTIVEEFITFFSHKYAGQLSLYRFGNVSHPSVSDLDLAIVIDEESVAPATIRQIVKDAEAFIVANGPRQYIFIHGILIYSGLTFAQSNYIHFTSNLQLLYGKPTEMVEIREMEQIWDLRYIAYVANTIKDFERIRHVRQVSLRKVLKVMQAAFHEFKIIEEMFGNTLQIHEGEAFSQTIKQMRQWVIQTPWTSEVEQKLSVFFKEVYEQLKMVNILQMDSLSMKIFGESVPGFVYVLENGRLEKRHRLFIELAASYARIFEEEGNCYGAIHRKIFPLKKKQFLLVEPYETLIRKQAQALLPACRLYQKYGATQVLGPMMCYHCSPAISFKQKFVGIAQWFLFRIQGL
jgi:hypothetical protein